MADSSGSKVTGTMKGSFLGDTPGNRNIPINRTQMGSGGSGQSHSFSTSGDGGKPTKGNSYLPPDRTTGYKSGTGSHKAGGGGRGNC